MALDNGRLQKVGYKYVLPQSLNKKQVSKKATEKNEVLKKATGKKEVAKKTTDKMKIAKKTPEKKSLDNRLMQNVRNSPPENAVKRSPGILQVRDTVMTEMSGQRRPLDRDASNVNIFSHTMNDKMPSQIILPNIQSQTISTAASFQTVIAEEPLKNTIKAELYKFFQTFNAEESAQNTEDGTSTQNAGEDNGTVPNF
ncbi:hypothetical protein JTE90_013245 [Oedothorax gibbosus]|uniref:Uncharacterized protein n=1 Tax=Oedothorax gibbosus TaxID=931172 RepID=A0AAV6VER1_9ARAC|nr:hypothetical protein JTE90_013245 [Oedothorax gibbosus]